LIRNLKAILFISFPIRTVNKQFYSCFLITDVPRSFHSSGFLLECLADLDNTLRKMGSRLHVFRGCPLAVFRYLHSGNGLKKVCFEQDCEPIWHFRDDSVKSLLGALGVKCSEHISHTLWDPMNIIVANGGTPPLTYDMFVHVAMSLGDPPKPVEDPDWTGVNFSNITAMESAEFVLFEGMPSLSEIGVADIPLAQRKRRIIGGEVTALKTLETRLRAEKSAFLAGFYQPNQARPDLLGPPLSISSAISMGAISVRFFYHKVHDLFDEINRGQPPARLHITGQLIWREYFYTMSRLNSKYDKMKGNPICLQIPWKEDEEQFQKWVNGMTGYPFIDAGLRQLIQEGWMHHSVRNAVAMFLTRGDLWLHWEKGADHLMNHLVDCDWSVNSGNWMWVSSSAFERLLDCSVCINSVSYGKRLEPSGNFIRRFVPELANFPFEYIHEPWKAPIEAQQAANCLIGKDYPARMVIHEEVSRRNREHMVAIREKIVAKCQGSAPPHCKPSSENEVYQFFCIAENCHHV